nr:hypothetical protein [Bradyrhizobium japonicum]
MGREAKRSHFGALARVPGELALQDAVDPFLDGLQFRFARRIPDLVAEFVKRLQLALGSGAGSGETPGCHENGDQRAQQQRSVIELVIVFIEETLLIAVVVSRSARMDRDQRIRIRAWRSGLGEYRKLRQQIPLRIDQRLRQVGDRVGIDRLVGDEKVRQTQRRQVVRRDRRRPLQGAFRDVIALVVLRDVGDRAGRLDFDQLWCRPFFALLPKELPDLGEVFFCQGNNRKQRMNFSRRERRCGVIGGNILKSDPGAVELIHLL